MGKNSNVFNARKNKKGEGQSVRSKIPRHKDFEKNKLWDDLNQLYLECCAVTTSPAAVLPLVKNPELVYDIDDQEDLKETMSILAKDAKDYSEKLKAIKAKHEGKSGKVEEVDDMLVAYEIGAEYSEWLNSYQTVVLPNSNKILGMFEEVKQIKSTES
jgi:hypothetical protein